ncbi:MAG: hypothetical protein IPM47_17685 [Sphingobacteriales bacterium]|nr:MAG: hypothetical protein IPM47_17685 [Sphingobacteriales bacterium]
MIKFEKLKEEHISSVKHGVLSWFNRYEFNHNVSIHMVEDFLKNVIIDENRIDFVIFVDDYIKPVAIISAEFLSENIAEISGGIVAENYQGLPLLKVGSQFIENRLNEKKYKISLTKILKTHYKAKAIIRLHKSNGYILKNEDETYYYLEKTLSP